jgi:hypothetical protein
MSEKKVVKVIKREERVLNKPNRRSARQNKRKAPTMVSTVSGWVNDFQQRQREETSVAIESLIRARQQQPNEA